MACYPVGYIGLMVAPYSAAILWAVLIGIGACTFPLILSLIPMRARTAQGTAALSGWTQSAGYLIAAIRPFVVGAPYAATGAWPLPPGLLLVLAVHHMLLAIGIAAGRERWCRA